MLDDLAKAVEEAQGRSAQLRNYSGLGSGGFVGTLERAASSTESKDPEFRNQGMKLLMDFTCGKITMQQFKEGCDYLDQAAKLINPQGQREYEARRRQEQDFHRCVDTRFKGSSGADRRVNERE